MTNEELKLVLAGLLPSASFEEGMEWPVIIIEPTSWKSLAEQLNRTAGLEFDFLFCLTCVDWKTHLTMVFHLTSTIHRHTLVVKSKLDRNNAEIETVAHIWQTAEFHEREVYDLFGVKFLHHPDLRRLFMTDEYIGWPLRKDFEDAVNMIRL